MCPADHKDYSGVPLWRKLGIDAGARVFVVAPPPAFTDHLSALEPIPDGVTFLQRAGRDLDVAMLFVTDAGALRRRFEGLVPAIARHGRLWVAWPKKGSGVPTDVTFELVQSIGLAAGLVDNKSAAIDDVFQGLQFVYRAAERA